MSDKILKSPCASCPYRKDVPSGLWASEEYDKLSRYDAETFNQPIKVFACHAATEKLCHGWAVCHSNRGHGNELLALRVRGIADIPSPRVPLFASGKEAADHGKRDIARPDEKAVAAMGRLLSKHERLRAEVTEI
jgi:hypothetical protein